jgi:hypothetical protein
MDSVASNRLEQYPQLNPYLFPVNRFVDPGRDNATAALVPAPTPTAATAASGIGTRSVVLHIGHRNNCPDWLSSAESDVRQTWQGKTIMDRTKS